ncbi:MAG: hypothetical protein HYY58_00540 [Candidatus Omnitrophica bacterium]|nr:hypothetical protein [Candidatus Omnitrophota bacterium]
MKYVILRCEDEARGNGRTATLLEGARLSYLQHLAQAGAAGLIRPTVSRGRSRRGVPAIDRLHLHRSLFGLDHHDPEAAPGLCYAASVNLQITPEESVWCCDLVTRQDGAIVDPLAGRITTKESEILIQALDDQLGSESRRWEVGQGSQHIFVTNDPALAPGADGSMTICSPELLMGQPWRRRLPKGSTGQALQRLLEEASRVLEGHAVNRVRVDLGENPANMLWLWGAARPETPPRTFRDRTGLSGAAISNSFFMRGFAQSQGLDWSNGPTSLEEGQLRRLMEKLEGLIDRHDLVDVHLVIDTPDPVERLCAMERIDQLLLKPLTEALTRRLSPWRLLAVIDDRRLSDTVPFIGIGTELPRQPIASLNAQRLMESPLTFPDGSALFAWFTR